MGTELLRSQGPPDDGRPLVWRNEDRPGDVADVHAAHAAAGASLLTTNTLLAPLCAPADGERLARLGVAIASRFGLPVALSLGPGAANPIVYGTLASSGADLVLLETFPEAAAAAEAVRSVRAASPSLLVAALLVFAGDGRTLSCRTPAAAAAALLLDAGADAVGANCAPPDGRALDPATLGRNSV